MITKKTRLLFLLIPLVLFIGALTHIDRIFFKRGASFCVRFLFSSLAPNPKWDLPTPTQEELNALDLAIHQKFHYLAKGAHCFAFLSEDGNYVIKFHRYASHMRLFPWLTHPFSYQFNPKRKAIKAYNFEKLDYNFLSYKNSFENLRKETGLLFLHINKTKSLKRTVALVDQAGASYTIPLDHVTFILQKRAKLIYPTLDSLYEQEKWDEAKQVVSNIISLIKTCTEKGYVDQDAILRKNYGLLDDCAIHIDVGDLIKRPSVAQRDAFISHVKEMTLSLKKRLERHYPKLLDHYEREIDKL